MTMISVAVKQRFKRKPKGSIRNCKALESLLLLGARNAFQREKVNRLYGYPNCAKVEQREGVFSYMLARQCRARAKKLKK